MPSGLRPKTQVVSRGPLRSSVTVGGTWHKRFAADGRTHYVVGRNRRSKMLLQKYRENKQALMEIGREALAESRRLGLPISAKDLENEAKDRAAHQEPTRAAIER